MITVIARTKDEYHEALGPARGAILIAWLLPDGLYNLDGQALTRAELDQKAAGCDRLIICEDWQDWNKPPERQKNHKVINGVFYFGSWLYPPGGAHDNGD